MARQEVEAGRQTLVALAHDDERLKPPDKVTRAPLDPQLDLLPTHEMTWPNFERLLLRTGREVNGLRSVMLFGNSGQAQNGLDAVGINSFGKTEGIQGKRYEKFGLADLNKAIKKFDKGALPFEIVKFSIGISCLANERKVVERVINLNLRTGEAEVELWDRRRLSEMLRDRADIVREFFGDATASSFCHPYESTPRAVPTPDAVGVADAVMRGPAASCGASEDLASAATTALSDPVVALERYQVAARKLQEAGFPGHAALLDDPIASLHVRLGQGNIAARLMMDRVWDALANDRTNSASIALNRLSDLIRSDAPGDKAPNLDELTKQCIAQQIDIANLAVQLHQSPIGEPQEMHLAVLECNSLDMSRLILSAAEFALASSSASWIENHLVEIRNAVGLEQGDAELKTRLHLVLAECTGEWSAVISAARRRKVPRGMCALILARHARYLAEEGDHLLEPVLKLSTFMADSQVPDPPGW